jgi:hypothetical protein
MKAAAEELSVADARCRSAADEDRPAAFSAYRAAFDVYRAAQQECMEERLRSARWESTHGHPRLL